MELIMAENSGIEWTDHTFNPWWGCQKVSPGCEHCYAETLSNRFGNNIWGPPHATDRRLFGDNHWTEPVKWNRAAEKSGRRARVFCASMADVFEDHPQVAPSRRRLIELIEATPHLDWQLLTKRLENARGMVPKRWNLRGWPPNVWVGVSVEDQQRADERIPPLLDIPAAVRFLSCEPLLGPVDLFSYLAGSTCSRCGTVVLAPGVCSCGSRVMRSALHWIIVGGESGPGARPMHPQLPRDIRDQAVAAAVPFFFKQWGEYAPAAIPMTINGQSVTSHGDVPYVTVECPEIPWTAVMARTGKKAAGRELDGRTWDEFPEPVTADA